MIQVKAVIFDMDGVIIDTEGPVQSCCQRAAGAMGFELNDEFYVSELVGRGWVDCDLALLSRFGRNFSLPDFKTRFQQLWTDHLRLHGIDVKPGFCELVAFLHARGVPIAVATSTHAGDAEISLRAAGINERFDAFVTGDEVGHGKPHPEIYLTAASRLGVAPELCVAFEDSIPGVLAASRAGMRTFLVPENGRPPAPEAVAAAFQILGSLDEARAVLSAWMTAVD